MDGDAAAEPTQVWTAQAPVEPVAPARRGKAMFALVAVAALLTTGIAVAVTHPWSRDDGPPVVAAAAVSPTGAPSELTRTPADASAAPVVGPAQIVPTTAQLLAALPPTVLVSGVRLAITRTYEDLAEGSNNVCGPDDPGGQRSAVRVQYDSDGALGFATLEALSFASAAQAAGYLDRVARQVDCPSYRDGDVRFTVRARVYDATGGTLRFAVGFKGSPPSVLYRFFQVGNTVGVVQYFEVGVRSSAARSVDAIAADLATRLRGVGAPG